MTQTSPESGAAEILLREPIRLPSPPVIAVRLLDVVKKEDFSFGHLAAIIEADPALTAKVLRLANSPLYGLPSEVDSIERALVVLGADAVKNIALSFVLTKDLRRSPGRGFDLDLFWRRSVTAAVAAKVLASLFRLRDDGIFISALLQDLGIIVMYSAKREDYLRVMEEKRLSGVGLHAIEKLIFGFDHQELGHMILKSWGLPEDIYVPIRYHHDDQEVPAQYAVQAAILHLSDRISSVYHGNKTADKLASISAALLRRCSIPEARVVSLIDEVGRKSLDVFSQFEIDPGDGRPFSEILQEANEALTTMNLSNQMLVIELKQAKEKAEKLATELRDANKVLRDLAFRDSVTGLYNHRLFQEMMDKEVARAQRFERPLSLIFVDIDYFKRINDVYGHPIGDVVLKAVGSKLEATTRKSGSVARYGGEEFALIVPETDLNGATILAERCRQAIEQMVVPIGNQTVRTTVSVGVTSYSHQAPGMGKAQMLATADKALYQSKSAGRNKVSAMKFPE